MSLYLTWLKRTFIKHIFWMIDVSRTQKQYLRCEWTKAVGWVGCNRWQECANCHHEWGAQTQRVHEGHRHPSFWAILSPFGGSQFLRHLRTSNWLVGTCLECSRGSHLDGEDATSPGQLEHPETGELPEGLRWSPSYEKKPEQGAGQLETPTDSTWAVESH